jgi:hypothetical protein
MSYPPDPLLMVDPEFLLICQALELLAAVEAADPVLVTDEILAEAARMRELADQYVVIT